MVSYNMSRWLLFFLITVVFLGLILTVPFLNKIYPNIYVSGIYLGDRNKTDALNLLKEKYTVPNKVLININDNKSEILSSEIIFSIEYQDTIDRAYNYAHSGNYLGDFSKKISLVFKPINITPIIIFNEDRLLESLLIISSSIDKKPIYPSVKRKENEIIVNPGKNGVDIDIEKAKHDIKLSLSNRENTEVKIHQNEIKVALTNSEIEIYKLNAQKLIGKKIELKLDSEIITINDDELISFLTPSGFSDNLIKTKILEISRKLNRSPQDSVFIIENGKAVEFTPSKDGIIVDENSLLGQIKELPTEIDIPVIKTSPKIKNEDVNTLGINTLLAKGQSNFKNSIANRIYNINLAQSKFKGLLVPPNEIVSFNEVLGDVSGLTGYKAAYVIKDGKTVLGDGGGVCQVSTTLFRAVLNAGLPIIERRAHAYRVGYYEQGFPPGLDATVYSPTTDFKFKNDTPAYLLIQPSIDLNSLALTFEIYGTSDGRVSTVSKPIVASSVAPADDLYVDDPTLPAGQIKQIEHRAYGAKVTFNYKVTRNGEELINQKFVSNYRPWQAVYLRGIAQ